MQYLTCAQVADRLGCSTRHVQYLIADGELAAVNIARSGRPKYRIGETELGLYAERKLVGAGGQS